MVFNNKPPAGLFESSLEDEFEEQENNKELAKIV
jgi:hypothetical protein